MDATAKVSRVVIVGGGQAGACLAAALRQEGHAGTIIIVSDEAILPYSRPALSKGYLCGTEARETLFVRSEAMYEQHGIEVRTCTRAVSINRQERYVELNTGEYLHYDALALATGGRPRLLPEERLRTARNVLYLRRMEDADVLRGHLVEGARIVLIGGGYIGLEIAAAARSRGASVTVLEAMPRVLARVASPELSAVIARAHAEHDVTILTSARIEDYVLDAGGDVAEVLLADGTRLPADLVLVGIGVLPNVELAETAGLDVDDGIIVDGRLRTPDPHIYAIGDVARYPTRGGGRRRIESVPNAVAQANVAAAAILGAATDFENVPWFWSDQFDLKLQMVGLAGDYDTHVIRGDLERGRSGAIFYLKDGVVQAADVINDPKTFALARRMVAEATLVRTPGRLADPAVSLSENLLPRERRLSAPSKANEGEPSCK